MSSPYTTLPCNTFPSVAEWHAPTYAQFWNEIHPLAEPAILRQHCQDWDAVKHAHVPDAEFAELLGKSCANVSVNAFVGHSDMNGRFFYNDTLRGFNFDRVTVHFSAFLAKLLEIAQSDYAAHIYVGATPLKTVLPRFDASNQSPLPPEGTPSLAWIGNRSRIAPHFDTSDNIACVVRGPRTFLLYPPEQVRNLYVGPIDHNMAGQPASLVDPCAPDLDKFPKYEQAQSVARIARLEPGDAIFIPALHWHYVESYASLSMLVNYWWDHANTGHGLSSLAYAVFALRELPAAQRHAWKSLFEHYLFDAHAPQSVDHIPNDVKGILGDPSPIRDRKIKSFLQMLLR